MQSNGENLNARFENRGVKITASRGLFIRENPNPSHSEGFGDPPGTVKGLYPQSGHTGERELAMESPTTISPRARLGEKSAERKQVVYGFFMSWLKPRPTKKIKNEPFTHRRVRHPASFNRA
jgi:hypothetical protein